MILYGYKQKIQQNDIFAWRKVEDIHHTWSQLIDFMQMKTIKYLLLSLWSSAHIAQYIQVGTV